MSDEVEIGSIWRPLARARITKPLVGRQVMRAHKGDPDLFYVNAVYPDGRYGAQTTIHRSYLISNYERIAHYAHLGGGETGTPSPVSQDVV
jgi:hypothetical protein